jgi:hypothetical protein
MTKLSPCLLLLLWYWHSIHYLLSNDTTYLRIIT